MSPEEKKKLLDAFRPIRWWRYEVLPNGNYGFVPYKTPVPETAIVYINQNWPWLK